jgi:hypothetical protein
MKIFKLLNQRSSIALAALLCISAPQIAVAAQAPKPLVQATELCSHSSVTPAYYYYHGRRYPYRYRGMYFNHRRFSRGHWHYY